MSESKRRKAAIKELKLNEVTVLNVTVVKGESRKQFSASVPNIAKFFKKDDFIGINLLAQTEWCLFKELDFNKTVLDALFCTKSWLNDLTIGGENELEFNIKSSAEFISGTIEVKD